VLGVALLWVMGCAAKADTRTGASAPSSAPHSFTPSPLLELARSERELPPVRRQWLRKRFDGTPPTDTEVDDDGIRRTVRVHPFRLATPENLARAALRDAESRRPREWNQARFLIRATKIRASSVHARHETRVMVDDRDDRIARCLAEELTARTDVILRTPTALVIEQAVRTGPLEYALSVAFHGKRDPTVLVTPEVNEHTQACLTETLRPGLAENPRSARVELTAFSQVSGSPTRTPPIHRTLANEAAILGWIELERGAAEEALAYFEDAYWLYHRAEYKLLQAMALQKMGRPNMALTRYRLFVEQRPHAPETAMIRTRIAALESRYPPPTEARPQRARD